MPDVIEGFLIDTAFIDRVKSVHGILSTDANQIGAMTPHAITYFNTPTKMSDTRTAGTRAVGWAATTTSSLLVDSTVFPSFSNIYPSMTSAQIGALFAIVDRLAFMNDPTATSDVIEASLVGDATISEIYVAGSATRSINTTLVPVWLDNETQVPISVPNYVRFDISIPVGEVSTTATFLIYLNCDTFTQSYSKSTVVVVTPPLDYNTLLNAPIKSTTSNVFTAASLSATLAYKLQSPDMAISTMSGQASYSVTLVDGSDTVDVPFNLMYKGRFPTVSQIRDAIRSDIVASGVGTTDQWRVRAPGLFIISRFYIFPLWDKTYTKPTVVLNQAILQIRDLIKINQTVMVQAGLSVALETQAVIPSGYDDILLIAVPDASYTPTDETQDGSQYILDYFPDFQTCSSVEPIYALLSPDTQLFIKRLNDLLAKSSGASSTDVTPVTQEGTLSYYSVTVSELEICLITKECYMALVKEL